MCVYVCARTNMCARVQTHRSDRSVCVGVFEVCVCVCAHKHTGLVEVCAWAYLIDCVCVCVCVCVCRSEIVGSKLELKDIGGSR